MNKTLTLSIIGLLVAFPMAGCIENIDDLKDRLGASETAVVDPEPEPVKAASVNNTTAPVDNTPGKAPVARISVFGAGGALIYKASFEAADETTPVYVEAPVTLELLSSDSEVLQPGATLTNYSWDVAGMKMDGRKVSHEITDSGSYPITLSIEDSKGGTDTQSILVVVAPSPFTVETKLVTTAVIGVEGEGQGGTVTYSVSSMIDGKMHKIQGISFVTKGAVLPDEAGAAGPTACDTMLEIVKPDGESTGVQDSGSQETITFGESAEGDYIINVTGYACVAPEGVNVLVTATFLEIVDGLPEGGDGHGAHAGH